jgi:hypothetical protein
VPGASIPKPFAQHFQSVHVFLYPFCGTSFHGSDTLNQHLTSHYFPCQICGQAFPSSNLREYHTLQSHTWVCDICPKIFPWRQDLLQHIQECHVNPCQYCTRIFKTCQALLQHTCVSHWFKCTYCTTNTFTSQSLLEIHIGEQHTFTCQSCSLVFRREAELQKHATQHAQSCKFCLRSFLSASALKQHCAALHPFSCTLCNKTFQSETPQEDFPR